MRQLAVVITFFFSLVLFVYSQMPEIKWTFDLDDSAFGNAAIGDIDGDGKPEIVFSTYRNDSTIYALNAEDGSILWKYNTGGCNDVAPLIYDVDNDGTLEVVLAASCVPKTFCFDGSTGSVKWVVNLHGSDSPPSIADIDNDGKLEILHGNFGGYVTCLSAESGAIQWDLQVDKNSWIQTAPLILDADGDEQLDFIVANWSFGANHKIFCFSGSDQTLLWESDLPDDHIYHGGAVADLDGDGKTELVIGCYDGVLRVINTEDGSLAWDYENSNKRYIAAPPLIADFNGDNNYEIVFFDGAVVTCLSADGLKLWSYIANDFSASFRGGAVSDVNNDDVNDIVFGTDSGLLIALDGTTGRAIWVYDIAEDYGDTDFAIDHGPVIADFDGDNKIDVFVVGGHSEYPDIHKNFGRAYAFSIDAPLKSTWPMFRFDVRRRGTLPIEQNTNVNEISRDGNVYLSPNPAENYIEIQNVGCNANAEICNILGMRVIEVSLGKNNGKIDVSKLPDGVYFLLLNKKIYKFIKM